LIWESWPWKEALLRDASKLDDLLLEDGDEQSQVDFERVVFLAGFTIRKLLEARKLTDRTAFANVKCRKHPLLDRAKVPDRMNRHRLDEFYDFENGRLATVKLSFLSNQLIHSFAFAAVVKDEAEAHAAGIYVNSDYDRGKFLYGYDLCELTRLMRLVGNDVVERCVYKRDANGEWVTRNYGPDEPEALSG
jgi:hypothetical protein